MDLSYLDTMKYGVINSKLLNYGSINRFAVNEVSKYSYEQLLIMRSKFGD